MRQRKHTIPKLSRVDVEDGIWFYLQRSPGKRPDRDLPTCLTWFLEQLLFEQFGRYAGTDDDTVVGLNIGIDQPTKIADEVPAAEQALQAKHIAMQLAGLVANARIEGVAPEHQAVPDMILAAFEADAEAYTQYYFAFELVATLKQIGERIHLLAVPRIKVPGFEDAWAYLAEATRCWLFGHDTASVALCRAALELALREAIRRTPNTLPPPSGKDWDLNGLIRVARDEKILDDIAKNMAHDVRVAANDILHGRIPEHVGTQTILEKARSLVEHIVAATAAK